MLTSASYDYDSTITVFVGAGEKRFTVHRDVICVKSKFFRAACSDRWLEGQQKIVRLPEAHSTKAFQLYVDWTYTNELNLDRTTLEAGDVVNSLVQLHLLGDVLDDVKLRNKTLRLMTVEVREAKLFLNSEQRHFIWRHTAPNSSIRKWVIDHFASLADSTMMEKFGSTLPADLVLQTAVMLVARHVKCSKRDRKALEERLETYMEADDDA